MANGSFRNYEKNTASDSLIIHKHSLGEAALGYYKNIGKAGRIELYGGAGYGETENHDQDNNLLFTEAHGKYVKFFIQPDIGTVSVVFDGGMSLRFCFLNYFDFYYTGLNSTGKNHKSLFVEPVITGKLGYKCKIYYANWLFCTFYSIRSIRSINT